LNADVVVETGLSMGDSTTIFLEALSRLIPQRVLHTYELPREEKTLKYVEDRIRGYNLSACWRMHWMDSIEGAKCYDGDEINLLYLDSDHTYEQVWNELTEWSKHMAPYGMILGDDIWIMGNPPDGDLTTHDRIYKRNPLTNPCDVYWAFHEWAEKNNWKELAFTYPHGKIILYK